MAKTKTRLKKRSLLLVTAARRLTSNPRFLYEAGRTISALGIVGERRLRLIVFLAGITRNLPDKVSVLIKGASASGKSTTMKKTLQLFPPKCVEERTGLSRTAPAYGRGQLGGKILVLTEMNSGKEAQFLIGQVQSEGEITYEATRVRGAQRKTKIVKRTGTPVVLSTTTSSYKIHPDDQSRFLTAYSTETPKQTLRILQAQASGKRSSTKVNLDVWRAATSLLSPQPGDFEDPPTWLNYVAKHLPLEQIRVRRDWMRILALLRAIALCRPRPEDGQPLNISFADYCVCYRILEPVLAENLRNYSEEDIQVWKAISALSKEKKRAVTTKEVAGYLKWEKSRVYRIVKIAIANRLIEHERGTREKNEKRLVARPETRKEFLPSPAKVLKHNPKVGNEVKYVSPFTGKRKVVRR